MATKSTTASAKKAPAKKANSPKKASSKAAAAAKSGDESTSSNKKASAKKNLKATPSTATATNTPANTPAKKPAKRASRAKSKTPSPSTIFLPRAVACVDDDNPLMAHGGGGSGFGRCGGRMLSNRLEQQLCNRLGIAGVVHSHSPRHYEIRIDENKVAAYAPMIVLRGRGREGKGVIIEAIEDAKAPILPKIIAFREQYGQEFYITLVADDEVLDEVPLAAYDEACTSTNVHTLIARLAE